MQGVAAAALVMSFLIYKKYFKKTALLDLGGYRELNYELLNIGSRTAWMNLGYWTKVPNQTYAEACQGLAQLLADAIKLRPTDVILDVGFGCGEQVRFWISRYNVKSVEGINICSKEVCFAQQYLANDGFSTRINLREGSATDLQSYPSTNFDAVLSLDCAYHFNPRQHFFSNAFFSLRPGGRLGVADIILSTKCTNPWDQLLLWVFCKLSGLPHANMIASDQYIQQLEAIGFTDVAITDLSENVFQGFGDFTARHYSLYGAQSGLSSSWLYYRLAGFAARWNARRNFLKFVIVSAVVRIGSK